MFCVGLDPSLDPLAWIETVGSKTGPVEIERPVRHAFPTKGLCCKCRKMPGLDLNSVPVSLSALPDVEQPSKTWLGILEQIKVVCYRIPWSATLDQSMLHDVQFAWGCAGRG